MKFASERNRAAARGSSVPLLTLMATCRLGESCWYKYTFASEPEPNFWANVYPGKTKPETYQQGVKMSIYKDGHLRHVVAE